VEDSSHVFAFEWEDAQTGRKQQYRWIVLPQSFSNSPNLFGQTLEQVLEGFILPPQMSLLQYTDNHLLSGLTKKEVTDTIISLLIWGGQQELRVSKPKL
jgi:hypothetical protein